MNRSGIVFLVLTIVLILSGCNVQSEKNVEDVSSTLNALSTSGIEKDNISAFSKISASEPVASSAPEITSENMNQCTDFTVQGGRIYFSNEYDNGTLYRINIDGSEKCKLNDDCSPLFYVSGDQIYYENDSDGSKLYSITTDGKDRRKLSDDKLVSIFWSVFDGRIYYNNHDDADSLYTIKIDGSDRKKLSDNSPVYMNVLGGRIYSELSGNKGIYSMKTDGSEKIKLSDDEPFGIVVVGDWIYYSNTKDSYKLYAMRTDGSDRHKVSDDYAPNMSVVNDRIYYQKGDDWRIFSVKTDGSDRQLLSKDHGDRFTVWDGRIYYMITGAKIYSMSTGGDNKQLLVDLSNNAYKDVTYEVSDRLHKDMPEYRFVAMGMTGGTEDYEVGFVMGMKVFDEKGHLILSADFSETFGDEVLGNPVYNEMMDTMGLHIVDVNYDGYKDVMVLNGFSGAHGNTWYNCWLWDHKTSSFVKSKSFTKICNPALDPKNKCIYSAGGSGAEFWGGSIYKYINGKFIMTNNLDADSNGLTETKLVNGKMVVVRKVSYTAGDKSEDVEMHYYKKNKLWQLNNPRWYMGGGHEADQWLGGKSPHDQNTNATANELNAIEKKLENYLKTKKIDAVLIYKNEDSKGTDAIMESHMTFPCVYVENIGITFIYTTQDDDSLPIYLSINSDTNKEKIDILGAKPGMTFDEIKKNLKGCNVKKTWIASEEDEAYELNYIFNGFKYSFVSYEKDGKSSELYITKADK